MARFPQKKTNKKSEKTSKKISDHKTSCYEAAIKTMNTGVSYRKAALMHDVVPATLYIRSKGSSAARGRKKRSVGKQKTFYST